MYICLYKYLFETNFILKSITFNKYKFSDVKYINKVYEFNIMYIKEVHASHLLSVISFNFNSINANGNIRNERETKVNGLATKIICYKFILL